MFDREAHQPSGFGPEHEHQQWWLHVWNSHRLLLLALCGLVVSVSVIWCVRDSQGDDVSTMGSSTPALHSIPPTHESRRAAEQEKDQRVRELGVALELGALNTASGSGMTASSSPAPEGPAPVVVP